MKMQSTSNSSFLQLFSRIFAGVGGGLLGTSLSLLMIISLTFSSQQSSHILESTHQFSGISFILIIFVASFVSNISSLFFLTLVDKQKYKFRKRILQGGFFANIFLFLFALPFYIGISDQSLLLIISGVHLFISASTSALFAEIYSGIKYVISGVVGVGITQMIMIFAYIGLGAPSSDTIVTVLFLPFIWFLLPLFIFITEKMYAFFSQHLEK